ncbi:thiol-disulfide oxidoreductase DCC family protein [Pseudomonas boanensis]|uniref:thiol-disulfide oxidoreductase DCC family protein n=1 Tax=Metapseudomonas boanensis TaxID=2822138 RepID=UPI0035D4ADB8
MHLPPHLKEGDKVVLFDGVCKLCNGWSQFLIRHDTAGTLKLCSVQSPEGQAILAWFGLPTDHFPTMLFVAGARAFDRSDAVLYVVRELPSPWRYAHWLKVIPQGIRDWCYDRIALNRYRLFGRYDRCIVPSPEHRNRFIGHGQQPAGGGNSGRTGGTGSEAAP